jgi:GT2 family glycosyltransferase
MPSASPSVSIVTLNWNGLAYLPACLAALVAQTYRNFELLIVENGSTDGSVAYLTDPALFTRLGFGPDQVRVLHSPTNLGFSGGNNLAFAQAGSDYIATINNDTIANPDWLGQMVAAITPSNLKPQTSNLGMIAAALLFTSRPHTIAAAGLELHRDGLALERLAGRPYQPAAAPYEVFGPTAGAALYSRQMLAELGGFDVRYFAYLEDVDLAWRARLRGWRCLYAPAAAVLHHYSATGVQGSPFKSYHLARNRIWTIAKNLPASLLRTWLPYIVRYEAMAVAYGLLKRDTALLRGRLDALRDLGPMLAARRAIQRTRAISDAELAGWFRPPITVRQMLAQRRRTDELAGSRL